MSDLTYGVNPAFARPADALDDGAPGLTKREYFAAAALQGLLSRADLQLFAFPVIAGMATRAAGALIESLNKPEPEGGEAQ